MQKCIPTLVLALALVQAPALCALEKPSEESLDTLYQESFDVPEELSAAEEIMRKATSTDSVFQVAQATNTNTTGHGNVVFRVTYNSSLDRWDLLLWSKDSYGSCAGYRKWYRVDNPTFGSWPYGGGALCVGWPATYNNMHENIQIIDHDLDGDLDVFVMLETSPKVWTVYLYKNLEAN